MSAAYPFASAAKVAETLVVLDTNNIATTQQGLLQQILVACAVTNDGTPTVPPVLTGWGEAADGTDLGEFYVTAINLSWSSVNGATNYELYRVDNPPPYGVGTYSLLTAEAGLTYRDATVTWNGGSGPFYGYKVVATNGDVSTLPSNELVFTPAFVPPPT